MANRKVLDAATLHRWQNLSRSLKLGCAKPRPAAMVTPPLPTSPTCSLQATRRHPPSPTVTNHRVTSPTASNCHPQLLTVTCRNASTATVTPTPCCSQHWFPWAPPRDMLTWLRTCVGLPPDGPAKDILIWRETGRNDSPTSTQLDLDWQCHSFGQLALFHGDVLHVRRAG